MTLRLFTSKDEPQGSNSSLSPANQNVREVGRAGSWSLRECIQVSMTKEMHRVLHFQTTKITEKTCLICTCIRQKNTPLHI